MKDQVKIIKRDTLADLAARRIPVKPRHQQLLDEKRRLLQRVAEIKRELATA